MGKGEIISAEGAGAYRLKILHDRERAEAQITKLQEEITALGASIANKDTEISTAEDEAEYLAQVLDAKIHALGQEEEPTAATEQAVKDATRNHAEAVRLVASLRQAQAYMRLRAVACEKRIGWIEDNIPADETVDAWCADYNEELTGNVGTVEVGREGGTLHVIVPGGADGSKAAYDAARDGQLQPVVGSTAAASFVNYALLPGVAKWRPRYRTGTITALNGDTCALTLTAATSTHQGFDINQAGSLAAVPIEYMTCNGAAFEVGDEVIVEFTGQAWDAPKVVGFVREPKRCLHPWAITVNPASTGKRLRLRDNGGWVATEDATAPAETIDWVGPESMGRPMVAWHQGYRYRMAGNTATKIYVDGIYYAQTPQHVLGACLTEHSGQRYIVAMIKLSATTCILGRRLDAGVDTSTSGWEAISEVFSIPSPDPDYSHFMWFFNESGTEAQSLCMVNRPWGTGLDPDSPSRHTIRVKVSINHSAGTSVFTEIPAVPAARGQETVTAVGETSFKWSPSQTEDYYFWRDDKRTHSLTMIVAVDYIGENEVVLNYVADSEYNMRREKLQPPIGGNGYYQLFATGMEQTGTYVHSLAGVVISESDEWEEETKYSVEGYEDGTSTRRYEHRRSQTGLSLRLIDMDIRRDVYAFRRVTAGSTGSFDVTSDRYSSATPEIPNTEAHTRTESIVIVSAAGISTIGEYSKEWIKTMPDGIYQFDEIFGPEFTEQIVMPNSSGFPDGNTLNSTETYDINGSYSNHLITIDMTTTVSTIVRAALRALPTGQYVAYVKYWVGSSSNYEAIIEGIAIDPPADLPALLSVGAGTSWDILPMGIV
ncbi:MAG: hypothetical protein RBS34_13895 [Desulfofustis sp.]|jgi:hypothetical protein|nr:hypothetical protein [Desulfofustis sp.]